MPKDEEFGAEEQSADLKKRHGKKRTRELDGDLLVNGEDPRQLGVASSTARSTAKTKERRPETTAPGVKTKSQ